MGTPTAKPKQQHSMVTGLFPDRESADLAYQAIKDREGYGDEDVNFFMMEDTRQKYFPTETTTERNVRLEHKSVEGATTGALAGGALGGVAGAIAAIGASVAVPGLGLVIAGPLAGAFAGATAGSAAGTLLGGLVGAGIPERRAGDYERGLKEGGIVVRVAARTEEDASHFEEAWKRHGGKHVYR
jgi:hypothetical protein